MKFSTKFWTKDEKHRLLKKRLTIILIALGVFLVLEIAFYIKKTNSEKVTTTEGIKYLNKLSKKSVKDAEIAIEDRRNARDEKSKKIKDENAKDRGEDATSGTTDAVENQQNAYYNDQPDAYSAGQYGTDYTTGNDTTYGSGANYYGGTDATGGYSTENYGVYGNSYGTGY